MRRLWKGGLLLLSAMLLWACGVNSAERNNAGNSMYEEGNFGGALQAYQAAQVVEPDSPEFYFNAANALIQLQEYDKAVSALELSLQNADDALKAQAYYSMGNIYYLQEQYTEAIDAYRQVLLINPDDEDARHNLELALLAIVAPTPTALEQKVEPEEDASDLQATPTENPSGQDGPTPTPPPVDAPPDLQKTSESGMLGEEGGVFQATPVPKEGGEVSIEDAERLLDSIQQKQQTLRAFNGGIGTPGPVTDNDW